LGGKTFMSCPSNVSYLYIGYVSCIYIYIYIYLYMYIWYMCAIVSWIFVFYIFRCPLDHLRESSTAHKHRSSWVCWCVGNPSESQLGVSRWAEPNPLPLLFHQSAFIYGTLFRGLYFQWCPVVKLNFQA
jgi:hypothetical protein